MEYLLTTFRSRADTVGFSELLRKNGINNEIVNTPKQAGVGCGLSVKTSMNYLTIIKKAVIIADKKSFAGFFSVKTIGGNKFIKAI